MFSGILVKESLKDLEVLDTLVITKTDDSEPAWTVINFKGEDVDAENTARLLVESLKNGKWYANFTTEAGTVYIIFPGKLFSYQKGNEIGRSTAQKYANSIGIPTSQQDWWE